MKGSRRGPFLVVTNEPTDESADRWDDVPPYSETTPLVLAVLIASEGRFDWIKSPRSLCLQASVRRSGLPENHAFPSLLTMVT